MSLHATQDVYPIDHKSPMLFELDQGYFFYALEEPFPVFYCDKNDENSMVALKILASQVS